MEYKNQCELVLGYIKDRGYITSAQAFYDLGITRLSGRIFDLRESGVKIGKIWLNGTNRHGKATRYAAYTLEE